MGDFRQCAPLLRRSENQISDLVRGLAKWEEAQLPMNVHLKCNIRSEFPEVADSLASYGRCSNCWEDCEDLDASILTVGMRKLLNLRSCCRCGSSSLCDLCKVKFRDGGICCLYCLTPPRGYALWPNRNGYHAEADEDYQARVASALAGLTEAQRKRWNLISAFGLGEDVHEDVF